MKKFTKGILTVTVLAAMSLMAAEDSVITVTTFDDEDGENSSKCSLREAITAASTNQAYGGCPKGDRYASNTKMIQLDEGTYNLKRELTPNATVYILGKAPEDFSRRNAINNDYPARTKLKTVISGQGSTRLFNTIHLDKPGLTLENIILKDGYSATPGGALLLGGNTQLSNVVIENSKANKGGAIFLNDINSHLTISNSVIRKNNAQVGSVIAMTCLDGLNYTTRKIDIENSSILENGANDSQSTFAFCGQPTAAFSSNTITLNTANSLTGSIFLFSGFNGTEQTNLSNDSSLTLTSNTIVKNTAASTLLYDAIGLKNLKFNALGFNTGKSCKFNSGNVAALDGANIDVQSNAIHLTKADICELPKLPFEFAKKDAINLDDQTFDSLFSALQVDKEFTDFLPMYFPREKTSGIDLVDASTNNGCSAYDQRGIKRIIESVADGLSTVRNTCDIGSTEVLRLTIENIINDTNKSMTQLLESYQENYDFFKESVENKETKPEYLTYYKLRRDEFANLIKFTKSDQKYRTIFVDPFVSNLPDEVVFNDGGRQIQHLNADNYTVTVKALGSGKIGADGLFEGQIDPNLKCEWNPNLKQIMMYRLDDTLTLENEHEFCQYTLTSKASKKSASAYIQGRFNNIMPNVAEKISVTVNHGGDQKVIVDLLKDANDDGDGIANALTKKNKSPFFLNAKGETQAIRIVHAPSPVLVRADRSGPCPNADSKYICYGGNVTMQLNNTLDVFSYDVKYVVYDLDGAPSAEGLVELKNTATAPGSVRNNGGGGSMGWLSLIVLIGTAAYRFRRKQK